MSQSNRSTDWPVGKDEGEVANCSYSAPTKVVKVRQRPLQLSEKLLEMLNEHFHTFGRPRFGKRYYSNDDWMYFLPPQEVNDVLWLEDFEPLHRPQLLEPVAPEFIVDTNDDSLPQAQRGRLLRSLRLDYN
ncbi:unnamed protein product [Hydatigera taeniaeformis]|uniref:Uncharacterized protein n=1 Tax=Hydatigena taeniaeformis TaxID=6205 RepID=A0A0R3X7I2_HYDTA|nr:unnamed protein product [Hydatigera taeniaeformis]